MANPSVKEGNDETSSTNRVVRTVKNLLGMIIVAIPWFEGFLFGCIQGSEALAAAETKKEEESTSF